MTHDDEIDLTDEDKAWVRRERARQAAMGVMARRFAWVIGIIAALATIASEVWPLHKSLAGLSAKGKVTLAFIGSVILGRVVLTLAAPALPEIAPLIGRFEPLPIWRQADTFPAVLHAHSRFNEKEKYHDARAHSL